MQPVEKERPPGLKPALNLRDLRSPKGPLFHGDPHVGVFPQPVQPCRSLQLDQTISKVARTFASAINVRADYATWRRLSSMPKNSDTNSSSQSPLRASARIVTAACSWPSAGL